MAQKEAQGGGGEGSIATTFFAQIGYVVMVLMALFGRVTIIDVLTAFVIIMLVGIIFQFVLTIQAMRVARAVSHGYDQSPNA